MASLIVAGGGIAGLAAAIGAARAGHEVLVLEQAPAFTELGAGIQIGPNGRRALEELGAWEWLRHHVFHPDAIRIRRARTGAELGRVPLGDAFRRRFRGTYQVVHRADLLASLLAVAEAEPAITLKTAARVTGYEDGPGAMAVRLADGSVRRAQGIIGADGIHSRIRAQLLGERKPRFSGHVLYRALVPMDEVPDVVDRRSVNLWLNPYGHVVHYPVKGGTALNIVVAVNEQWRAGDTWGERTDAASVFRIFSRTCEELKAVLGVPAQWMRWAGADRPPVNTWGHGALTLIGDAAHPTLPYLASGAVMALEDAVVLMRHLAQHETLPEAFRAYEKERQPRTARIVNSSWKLSRVYHATGLMAAGRDAFIRLTSGRRGFERMAWLYDWRP